MRHSLRWRRLRRDAIGRFGIVDSGVSIVVVVVVRQNLVHAHYVRHHRFLVDDDGLEQYDTSSG